MAGQFQKVTSPDHPRSRGVYGCALYASRARPGSSPLARGLRRRTPRIRARQGIIPARAGFTIALWEGRMLGQGSSPLARGLRSAMGRMTSWARIIPARAGFTITGMSSRIANPDHPRSRGVYALAPGGGATAGGSSPLARGLPRLVYLHIAPAVDHPRSRGVYVLSDPRLGQAVGSSPLARGLPRTDLRVEVAERIIPARAGFTVARTTVVSVVLDHPRSRGVYMRAAAVPLGASGSSPLARGLRVPPPGHSSHVGIIPARAGFTSDE